MKPMILLLVLLLPLPVSAKRLDCSIRPRDISASALPALAKVSQSQARQEALSSIKAPTASTVEGALAVEKGCLVYSFEIKVPGNPGLEEVVVDAGTGKMLSHKHVVTMQEADEKAKGPKGSQ